MTLHNGIRSIHLDISAYNLVKMKYFANTLFILLSACMFNACTQKNPLSGKMVFNTYVKDRIQGLDPALAHDSYSQQTLMQIYEGLLHFHYLKRPIQLEPQLSEGMPNISVDGLTYEFTLKKNIYFQDSPAFKNGRGREVTAEDFIYSWKRLADAKNKSENFWVFRNKIKGLDQWRDLMTQGKATYASSIEGLHAPDPYHLVIHLLQPDSSFLYLLASSMTVVVPKEAVEYYGADFVNHPVGTGAFILESWSHGSRVILTKNPHYRPIFYPSEGDESDRILGRLNDKNKQLPFLDRIVINEMLEEQPQWLSFLKGDIDNLFVPKDNLAQAVTNNHLSAALAAKDIQLQLAPSIDITYISFNTENKFLKNKKLRQAMSMAYNKKNLIKMFYDGHGTPAHGPIPPGLNGYRKDIKNPNVEFNIVQAQQLLKEAGFENGKGLPTFTFELGAGHSTARQMAEFFQMQMAAIGIKIKLHINTWAQFSDKILKKQADIFDMTWNADYPEAGNFFQLFYSKNISPGPNNSNFKNATYDTLYETASRLPEGSAKTHLYEKMEDLLMDETPWIFNLHRVRVILNQAWLKNYKPSYVILDSMKYYRIDMQERQKLKSKR
jgi:oligopeptide transport system substrate-binding protein